MADAFTPDSPFAGTPIQITVEGPTEDVTAGDEFVYTVKVQDIDQKTIFNPTGIDASTSVYFEVPSMSRFQFQIAPNPDPEGWLVCMIRGYAVDEPGIYTDGFRGYDSIGGVTWDPPKDVLHNVKVKPRS